MKFKGVALAILLTLGTGFACAEAPKQTVYPIDLAAALRLAGARNLDIQTAREHVNQARADEELAIEQFFPWFEPGAVYHRRNGLGQSDRTGIISAAHYDTYSAGGLLTAQVAFGEAIYNELTKRQLVKASDQGLEAQRQDTIFSAAVGYFDLAKAAALVKVVEESLKISADYQKQEHDAVAAGIAFRGDELRVQTQTQQYEINVQQAREQQRLAAVSLAVLLHLDSRIELVPVDAGVASLTLFPITSPLNALVDQAMKRRPELKQGQAFLAAGLADKSRVVYGPLFPNLDAQAFGGGYGGGPDHTPNIFGSREDYSVNVGWRIGPGGLFDFGRIDASKAQLATTQLANSKVADIVVSEVVSGFVQINSLAAQIQLAERNIALAGTTLTLTEQRKEYGVGIVLENIQALQALMQARSGYITAIAEYNKAQYALKRAVGGPVGADGSKKSVRQPQWK